MPRQRVFLAVDNISDISCSIEDAQSYLSLDFAKGSKVLITARSPVILNRLLPEAESIFMPVPTTNDRGGRGHWHPTEAHTCGNIKLNIQTKAFGAYLYDRFSSDLSAWNAIPAFRDAGGGDLEQIHYLKKRGLIEDDKNRIDIHELLYEFAQKQANDKWKSWCFLREAEEVPICLKQTQSWGLEGVKFSKCLFQTLPISYNPDLFGNILVLHLESMCELRKLDVSSLKVLKSLVVDDCENLEEIYGIEGLPNLACIQIHRCSQLNTFPPIGNLTGLKWFHFYCPTTIQMGDICNCESLRQIYMDCELLEEFPRLGGLPNLRNIHFYNCSRVTKPLDLSDFD
eukprot:Gb_41788 [translate_table: standard]